MTYARVSAFCPSFCLLSCLLLLSFAAVAAPGAVVDAVVMPAWLERGGRTEALVPGTAVRQNDRIRTGAGARVYLRLAEGSTVKIGANAKFALGEQADIDKTFFAAAYDVLAGAFRFTTDKLRRHHPVRDVEIKVVTATIGIRGTDVWGKADDERDMVILIEGNIVVTHASGVVTPMGAERAQFVAPRGAAPLPLSRISEEELAKRARETEIEPGDGVARRGGKAKIRLGTELNQEQALELHDRANHHGYAVTIKPRGAEGYWTYDVLLGGFVGRDEAKAIKDRLPEKLRANAEVL